MNSGGQEGRQMDRQREKTVEVGIIVTVHEILNKNHIIFLCLRSYSFQNNCENRAMGQIISRWRITAEFRVQSQPNTINARFHGLSSRTLGLP